MRFEKIRLIASLALLTAIIASLWTRKNTPAEVVSIASLPKECDQYTIAQGNPSLTRVVFFETQETLDARDGQCVGAIIEASQQNQHESKVRTFFGEMTVNFLMALCGDKTRSYSCHSFFLKYFFFFFKKNIRKKK